LPGLHASRKLHQHGSIPRHRHGMERIFSHTSPTQGSFNDRARRFRIGNYAGENIARNYGVTDAVTAWMRSPGHRSNILNRNFRSSAIGYATNGLGQPFYVQCFSSLSGG
ncbi:MAG: CAP domain-containing protein, partial [Calothrix sp. SM1_5_4]|nr:CAP domain-containing protein [Calothrix sp. SM1_5_4]